MLNFRLSARRAKGHGYDLSLLAAGDRLMQVLVAKTCENDMRLYSEATFTYFLRKKEALRAAYFRQRYGRDFYAKGA